MNEKDEERMRWSSTKTIKKNLNTENWIDFNEQFTLVIARTNADVEIKTGKDPVWKKPSQTDTKPIINSNTGLQMNQYIRMMQMVKRIINSMHRYQGNAYKHTKKPLNLV